jgi:hypothetical protein
MQFFFSLFLFLGPAHHLFSFSSLSSPSRVAHLARPFFFPLHSPAWPSLLSPFLGPASPRTRASPFFPLADRRAPPIGALFFPEPDSASSPSPAGTQRHPAPRGPQARTPRPLRPPYKSAALCPRVFPKPQPPPSPKTLAARAFSAAAASALWSPSLSPLCHSFAAAEAPPCGKDCGQQVIPHFPCFPVRPIACRRPEPYLAAGHRLRPASPLLKSLDVFPSSLSCSQAKPEPKPWSEMHLRVYPSRRRPPPPLPLPAGDQRRPVRAASRAPPPDPDPTV